MNDQVKIIKAFWADMDGQKWNKIACYFEKDAVINWPNTNESFCPDEFVQVNAEYPGNWLISIDRVEQTHNSVITVVHVRLQGSTTSFHAVSFFELHNNKIALLNEYWGDDGAAPQWRIAMSKKNRKESNPTFLSSTAKSDSEKV